MSYRPVSRNCPACGSTEFRKVKADALIAFTDDRKCLACGTRYAPPTPAWAAVLFIVLGVLITAAGIGFLVAFFAGLLRAGEAVRSLIYGPILIVFGLACVRLGVVSLRRGREGDQGAGGQPAPPAPPQ